MRCKIFNAKTQRRGETIATIATIALKNVVRGVRLVAQGTLEFGDLSGREEFICAGNLQSRLAEK